MIPKQPPKRTPTRPGLGIEDVLTRLESSELEKVRDGNSNIDVTRDVARDSKPEGAFTPPPTSRARVPREDDDVPPESIPRSDRFQSAPRREPHPATRPRPAGSSPVARQQTAVGLGSKTHPQDSPSSRRPGGSDPAGPVSRPPVSRPPVSRPPSSKPGRWQDEAPSGPRSRKPLAVDSVGDTATRIARNTRQIAPKVIASQALISSAPLDSRSAFVLSLVDGTSDVPAIVDATGMPSDEVIAILARLARLGLISVP